MSGIDWSKAPEGSTHYREGVATFYKQTDRAYEWNAGRWQLIANDLGEFRWSDQLIDRPSTAWNGEGWPPVGVKCEAAIPHTSGPNNERSFIWIEGSVIAYYEIKGKTYSWFAEDDGFYPPNVLEFRPICTPEQIAAEEREAAIEELRQLLSSVACDDYHAAVAMIDAGYRKQADK